MIDPGMGRRRLPFERQAVRAPRSRSSPGPARRGRAAGPAAGRAGPTRHQPRSSPAGAARRSIRAADQRGGQPVPVDPGAQDEQDAGQRGRGLIVDPNPGSDVAWAATTAERSAPTARQGTSSSVSRVGSSARAPAARGTAENPYALLRGCPPARRHANRNSGNAWTADTNRDPPHRRPGAHAPRRPGRPDRRRHRRAQLRRRASAGRAAVRRTGRARQGRPPRE